MYVCVCVCVCVCDSAVRSISHCCYGWVHKFVDESVSPSIQQHMILQFLSDCSWACVCCRCTKFVGLRRLLISFGIAIPDLLAVKF